MRYLQTYKLFEDSGEKEMSNYINLDLIDMAYQLSLEYLDDGYIVNLEIRYTIQDEPGDRKMIYIVYDVDWDHEDGDGQLGFDFNGFSLASVKKILSTEVDKSKFDYHFMIYKMDIEPYKVEDIGTEEMNDFLSTLKQAFPEEDIEIHEAVKELPD